MKCRCLSKIEEEVKKMDYDGKKVLSTKFLSAGFVAVKKDGVHTMDIITTSELEVELQGVKKKKVVNMMHSYCPFCGKKTREK
jgi:hypothetical protein